jgi:hypothetical protein
MDKDDVITFVSFFPLSFAIGVMILYWLSIGREIKESRRWLAQFKKDNP